MEIDDTMTYESVIETLKEKIMSGLKSIYDLKLHECLMIHKSQDGSNIGVCRVPGGWIYEFSNKEECKVTFLNNIFVPFDKEFIRTTEYPLHLSRRS